MDPEVAMEESYLQLLNSAAKALKASDLPPMLREVFKNERITTGPAYAKGQLFAVLLRLQPNARIEPHDHPGHVVLTMGLAGMAHYQHYEHEGRPPAKSNLEQAFRVREMRRGVLRPGSCTHLSLERDNIHAFQAGPEGALLVDFLTTLGGPDFGMLRIDSKSLDAFESIHDARWLETKF